MYGVLQNTYSAASGTLSLCMSASIVSCRPQNLQGSVPTATAAPAQSHCLGMSCLLLSRQLLRLQGADLLAEEGQLLLQCVEGLAEAHGAFAQLFDLCEALDDAPRLHEHMQRSLASSQAQQQHSCAEYVFGRLVAEGRCNRLLSLPDSFAQPLSAWLAAQVQPQLSLSLSRHACEQHVVLDLAPSLPRSVLSAAA